jgi:hypothetical protein
MRLVSSYPQVSGVGETHGLVSVGHFRVHVWMQLRNNVIKSADGFLRKFSCHITSRKHLKYATFKFSRTYSTNKFGGEGMWWDKTNAERALKMEA